MARPDPTIPLDRILTAVKWLSPDEFVGGAAHQLSPLWRALLTTDGSTTMFLQALCLRPIQLEVADQQTGPLPPLLAGWLDATPSGKVLQRSVWLTDGTRRLALGHSLIALDRLDPALHQRLTTQTQPIGLLANELGLPSLRDRLQIGSLADPELARQFGEPPKPLWCRRYRLTIPDALAAVIIELFLPSLEPHSSA